MALLENNRLSSMPNDYSWDLPRSHWTRLGAFLPQALLDLESTEWHAYVGRMAVLVKVRAWQISFPSLPYHPVHNFAHLSNSIQCYKTFASPGLLWVFVYTSCMKECCHQLHIFPKICHENLFPLKVTSRSCTEFETLNNK